MSSENLLDDSSGSDFANFTHNKTVEIPLQGGVIRVDEQLDLQLKNKEKFWKQYKKDVEDFFDWFDEKKEKVEANFKSKSGEEKIAASKQQISFILEAKKKWDAIHRPTSGEWSGDLQVNITSVAMQMPISGVVKATFTMKLLDPPSRLRPSVVKGSISNGSTNVNVAGLDASGDFTGDIVGQADNYGARICAALKYSKISFENPFKRNTPLAIFTRVDHQTFYNVWTAFESFLGKIPKLKAQDEVIVYQLFLHGFEKDFDYMEHLIEYYKLYVSTISSVRKAIFDGINPSSPKKHESAYETIHMLLDALSNGQSLGIPQNIIQKVGLEYANERSLYDKWFRLWFPAALEFWNLKVQKQKTKENLSQRVQFVLEATMQKETPYFSKKPFIDFKLTLPGEALDSAYKAYYPVAVDDWAKKILEKKANLDLAVEWLYHQLTLAGDIISTKASQEIELLPSPPKALQLFMKTGGVR